VGHTKDGIEAEVLVVKNFDELKSMPREKVAGKIVLFNYPFDKQMAAEGRSFQLMAKQLFIAVTGRAQPRGKALLPV
jgi:hypothetical protein